MVLEHYLPELKVKGAAKKHQRADKRARLLALFPHDSGYSELHKDGKWYVKMWNGNSQFWQVATYSEESFLNYKTWRNNRELDEDLRRNINKGENEVIDTD